MIRCTAMGANHLIPRPPCPLHARAARGGSGWQEQRDRKATIKRLGLRCAECGTMCVDEAGHPNSAEQDHAKAVANGGGRQTDNRRILCRTCNRRKGAA